MRGVLILSRLSRWIEHPLATLRSSQNTSDFRTLHLFLDRFFLGRVFCPVDVSHDLKRLFCG